VLSRVGVVGCGIDSNIYFQESQKRRPERGWNGEHLLVALATPPFVALAIPPHVILSEAKDLTHRAEILRFAQDDKQEYRMTLGD